MRRLPAYLNAGFNPGMFDGGGSPPAATRSFTLSPAIAGKTTWDLDVDGPCTFPVGVYTVTPLAGFAGDVEIWGPGGGSGGAGITTGDATSGTTSTSSSFTTGGTVMSVGAGTRSVLRINNTASAGVAGGSASGGDVNTVGTTGGTSVIAATCIGGDGGSSPNGGATQPGASAGDGVIVAGVAGNAPGGAASGPVKGSATAADRRAVGGPGGGGYCKRTFSVDELAVGVARTMTITAGGAGGTGNVANGAAGADGRGKIT